MNWYKLEAIREALREDHAAEVLPGAHGPTGSLEVWKRTIADQAYVAFLNYESDELLVPEDSLTAAATALGISPEELLHGVKSRSGLWLGPSPT